MWFRKFLAFGSLAFFCLGYTFMYTEDLALGFYGTKKSHGRDCMFVDAHLNTFEYHVRGRSIGYGVHGCPLFMKSRT